MYIEHGKCKQCRQDKDLTSGQIRIHFRDLTALSVPVDVHFTRTTWRYDPDPAREAVAVPQSTQIDTCPAIGYVVVTLEDEERIEPVVLCDGVIVTPTEYSLSDHDHSDELMSVLSYRCVRVRNGE